MTNAINTWVHLVSLVVYTFGLHYVLTKFHYPYTNRFSKGFEDFDPGNVKYLTIWNMIVQTVILLLCSLNDFYGTDDVNPKNPPFIRKLKDYLHASLGFPVAIFVGVTYWTLMFVNRELVFPQAFDHHLPFWLNHVMHTLIMPTTVLEMILAPRQYPKRSCGLGMLLSFMLLYLGWSHIIYYKTSVWVYPVMDVLTQPLQILFFAAMLMFSVILYFVGETLNNIVWGNEHTEHKKSHAKSK